MYSLIGVGVAFIVLGILISRKIDFGLALLAATAVLLLTSEPSFTSLVWVRDILVEHETINLVVVILLIGLMGFIYRDSGQVGRIIKELRLAVPDRRMVIASIPAIFGLLPMPGGALVSAPMIDKEGDDLGLDPVHKTFLNWWFRHAWFSIYPLELGLIIAASVMGVNLYYIVLFNIPIFIVHITAGVIFGLGRIEVKKDKIDGIAKISHLILDFLPIIVALVLNGLFGVPLFLCLLFAVMILLLQNRAHYELAQIPNVLRKGLSTRLFMAGLGIMMFKGVIERTGVLLPLVEILEGRVPLVFVILVAAFAIGLLVGHLPAAAGISFPIFVEMVPDPNFQVVAAIFLFVMMGYLVSPIHLCIILTLEYFKADMKRFYMRAAAAFTMLISAVIIWLLVTGTFFMF